MASIQCNRPANETCLQKCQGSSSLGQKKSSCVKGSQNGQIKSKPICQAQAQVQIQAQAQAQDHSCPKQGTCKASGHQHTLHTHSHGHGHSHTKHQVTNGAACHCSANKTNGHHGHNLAATGGVSCVGKTRERNLFRRIKNRISRNGNGNGNCSDGGSSSSSDSESDNECCHKRKN